MKKQSLLLSRGIVADDSTSSRHFFSQIIFRLCVDAVDLLVGLADSRALEMASSDTLYSCLAGVQLDRMPARRSLIQALVLIGASANDQTLQEKMYNLVRFP